MRKTARSARLYVEDILTAIRRIEDYKAKGKGAFLRDGKTQDAVIRQLSVIGEAASKLPTGLKARHPAIPWKAVVGMRNILIHDYSAVSVRRVWQTVVRDLPVLDRAMREVRATLTAGEGPKGKRKAA